MEPFFAGDARLETPILRLAHEQVREQARSGERTVSHSNSVSKSCGWSWYGDRYMSKSWSKSGPVIESRSTYSKAGTSLQVSDDIMEYAILLHTQ